MSIRSSQKYCFQGLKWIPVLFILGIVGWSYYAYVVQMCLFTIENLPKKIIYLFIYHLFLILFLWSYGRTMFKSLIGPPNEFYLDQIESERIAASQTIEERRISLIHFSRQANLPLLTRHFDGSVRYCFVCQCVKPDRAHHCSVCEKCVLRYDHHCPWTNSCVSFGNYKFFILFLGWALIFCCFVAGTSLEYFIDFWKGVSLVEKNDVNSNPTSGKFHLLFLFFASIMFGISVSSLFFYHLYLTGKNRTTLESFRAPIFSNGPQKEGFNLGCLKNFQEIFGTNFFKSLIPISTTRGDGFHYQINNSILDDLQNTTFVRRLNENSNNFTSQLNRNNEVFLPLENSSNQDRNYLLSGNLNNR